MPKQLRKPRFPNAFQFVQPPLVSANLMSILCIMRKDFGLEPVIF